MDYLVREGWKLRRDSVGITLVHVLSTFAFRDCDA